MNRRLRMAAGILAVCMAAGVLGGCKGERTAPVLAEKTANAGEKGGQPGDSFPAAAGSSRPNDQMSLAAQTEAPKRYQTFVKGEWIYLTSDAPVIVPEADGVPEREIRRAYYTEEEYGRLKAAAEKALGTSWQQERYPEGEDAGFSSSYSQGGEWYLSFRYGGTENGEYRIPSFWITNQFLSAGSTSEFHVSDVSGMELGEKERRETEERLIRQAKDLLKDMDLEQFELRDRNWKNLREYDRESRQWKPAGRYGLQLQFAENSGNMRIPYNGPAFLSGLESRARYADESRVQYVNFLYTEDGKLLELKNIGKDQLGESGENGFLLPFSAVTEIFEQCCKAYSGGDRAGDERKPHMSVTLSEVRLEYRADFGKTSGKGQPSEGKLVPVWNFYGKAELVYENPQELPPENQEWMTADSLSGEGNRLMLSIGAGAGHIYYGK